MVPVDVRELLAAEARAAKEARRSTRAKGGAAVLAGVLITLWLAVPRAVRPDAVPVPVIDRVAERREEAIERERARAAREEGLARETREAGERFRRMGAAAAAGDVVAVEYQEERLRAVVARLLAAPDGVEQLLGLRALQTELFVEACSALAASPEDAAARAAVDELGGDLWPKALASGWVARGALDLPHDVLPALSRQRWTQAAGLSRRAPFASRLTDELVLGRLALTQPLRAPGEAEVAVLGRQLAALDALERRQPAYPANLARGILWLRAGGAEPAFDALAAHRAAHPDGAWSLRATNYEALALGELGFLDEGDVPGED